MATLLDPGAGGPRRRRALPGQCGLGEELGVLRAAFRSTGNELRLSSPPPFGGKKEGYVFPVTIITVHANKEIRATTPQSRPISPATSANAPRSNNEARQASVAGRCGAATDPERGAAPHAEAHSTMGNTKTSAKEGKPGARSPLASASSTVASADASSAVSAVSRGENASRAPALTFVRSEAAAPARTRYRPARAGAAAQHTKRRGAGARRRRRTAPSASTA